MMRLLTSSHARPQSRVGALTIALVVMGLVLAVGCGPVVTVKNNTGFVVRAIVTYSGGHDAVAPSPGESSSVEIDEGPFTATAIPDTDWIEYAKVKRKVLNDQLANANNLSGEQLLAVVAQLKDIALHMKQFQDTAGKGASCSGSASSDSAPIVEVSLGAGGLVVACK